MRKVKVFYTEYRGSTFPKEKYDIDKQINEFIVNNNVDIIDIKFASHFDDGCNDDLSAGLLIYEDKSCDDCFKEVDEIQQKISKKREELNILNDELDDYMTNFKEEII